MIFEISYSGIVSDKVQDYVPDACQREVVKEEKFVSSNDLGRDSVLASGVLVCVQ